MAAVQAVICVQTPLARIAEKVRIKWTCICKWPRTLANTLEKGAETSDRMHVRGYKTAKGWRIVTGEMVSRAGTNTIDHMPIHLHKGRRAA